MGDSSGESKGPLFRVSFSHTEERFLSRVELIEKYGEKTGSYVHEGIRTCVCAKGIHGGSAGKQDSDF